MAIAGNLLPENAESIETDASAWQALGNATGLAQGSGGTLGSKNLLFKSVATGDTQVGTVTPVSVTAGTEYWACASVFPPVAGAQSRMVIRWYTSTGTLIVADQGPVVAGTSGSWNQVALVATAPVNAATATVGIRVTATVANQTWFADRIFLGLTSTSGTANNTLPFNTESVEVDSSGWTASALCTLGISTSAFTWYQSLRLTSTGAGSCLATTLPAQAPAVTPGTEYVAYAYTTAGTAGLTQKVQIRWLDGSGAEIGVSEASRTLASGQWARCVVVGTAPVGAAKAIVGVAPQATASGQQWAYDRIVLAPSSALLTTGNLLPYNVSEIEQDASGWTVTGGTGTQSNERVLNAAYALKAVAAGGDMTISLTTPVGGVVDGLGYQFAPPVNKSAARVYLTRIEWLNEAGDAVRTRVQSWSGAVDTWIVGTMADLAPVGAVAARLSLIVPDAPAGEAWYMDRVEWRLGGLTTRAEPASGGGAQITVRGLTTGGPTYLWSLNRIIAGQAPQPVRGWAGDLVSQSIGGDIAIVVDYEAPLGVPVQWRATLQNPSGPGTLNYTSDPVTLDAETTDVWLKDPGLPQRSARFTVATPMPTWTRMARQGTNQVHGRSLPVIISDVRGGKSGTLSVVTETDDERAALWWVLETGNTLLLQWPPGWGEDDMYVSVGDVQASPVVDFAEFHDRTWQLPLTQVDRPIGGVTGSADRTWQTVKDSATTWAEALANATSWLDVYTGA
ncbi:hypothetical protein AB0F77_39470 [Streptomyces sp. NPDC026672]|uniref:hypothetical protein n=1 Tax=Actinomycetes TaxID=1760 RepID=UPI003400CA2A